MSSCFEPHLGAYVELEEKTLMENLEKLIQASRFFQIVIHFNIFVIRTCNVLESTTMKASIYKFVTSLDV